MEAFLEFHTRPKSGKPTRKKYVLEKNFRKQIESYKKQNRLCHIIVMTTRPLGAIVVEFMRDANGSWLLHREGERYKELLKAKE